MGKETCYLDIKYHPGQNEIFKICQSRKRVLSKGRRWGFTRGASQYVIESMINGVGPVMWGDTIVANIHSYVERYFMPVLRQLPKNIWDWRKSEKKLYVNGHVCDFRSADQPENWEGFGYKLIILNEAGVILKNEYIWHNAVRPMLMDYPDSIAIIGGTPKGRNLFFELFSKGLTPEGKEEGWESFTSDSYVNPFIEIAEIDALIKDLPETAVKQEIYAEFADDGELIMIPWKLIQECMERGEKEIIAGNVKTSKINGSHSFDDIKTRNGEIFYEVWGLDIGRQGDFSCLAKRRAMDVYSIQTYDINDNMQLASHVAHEYFNSSTKPLTIYVDMTGMGWGVYDRLRELRVPVSLGDTAMKSVMPNVVNKRYEMYARLYEQMKKGLKLPNNNALRRQLSNVIYKYNDKGRLLLIPKEEIKKLIKESPDLSDAVALTYFDTVTTTIMANQKNDDVRDLVSANGYI